MTKVQVMKNGPYKVEGPVMVEDAQGEVKEFKQGEDAWLCRCGTSKTKPYCDGNHKSCGFVANK